MEKPRLYIEYAFWKQLVSDVSIDGMRSFVELFDLLLRSDVHMDVDAERLMQLVGEDQYLMKLWKYHMSGQLSLQLGTEAKKNAILSGTTTDIKDLMAVFLLDRSEAFCQDVANRLGLMVLGVGTVRKHRSYFDGDGIMVQRGKRYGAFWMSFADKLRQVCHSLIVVDPYIGRDRNSVEVNLLTLLDAVLPTSLSLPFHLSLFVMAENGYSGEQLQTRLASRLQGMRPDMAFELTIYQITKRDRFHDRYLLSNNVFVECGAGFDLFNDMGYAGKDTKVDIIYPHTQNHTPADTEAYWRFLEVTKRTHLRAFANGTVRNYWGTKVNRLFDAVEGVDEQPVLPPYRRYADKGRKGGRQ